MIPIFLIKVGVGEWQHIAILDGHACHLAQSRGANAIRFLLSLHSKQDHTHTP